MNKKTMRQISAILAAAVVGSTSLIGFADTPTVTTPQTQAGEGDPSAPQTVAADIRAYYTAQENNKYQIRYTSWTSLDDYSDIAFTVSFAEGYDAKVLSYDQNSSDLSFRNISILENDLGYSFSGCSLKGQPSRPVMCTVTVEAPEAPTAEKLTFTAFSAKNAQSEEVTFAPTLTVKEGASRHELGETLEALYNEMLTLPTVDSLSFYSTAGEGGAKSLVDTTALSKKVNRLKTDYNNLTAEQKQMFADNLEYDNKLLPDFENLASCTAAMNDAYNAVRLADAVSSVTDEDLTSYLFLFNVFASKVKPGAESSELTDKLTEGLKGELTAALTLVDTKSTAASTAYDAFTNTSEGYADKLDCMDAQFTKIQSMSTDTFYSDFLADLASQLETLKSGILTDLDGDRDKEHRLEECNEFIDSIKAVQNGISSLPTFKVSTVTYNREYSISVTRPSNAAPEASIKVTVFNDAGTQIDTKTSVFAKGSYETAVALTAAETQGYNYDKDITVKLSYIIQNAEFPLGSATATVEYASSRPTNNPSGTVIGGGNSGSSNGSSSPSSGGTISGGTKFPGSTDTPTDNIKPIESETVLFNDISNYDWAKEAIEGLYYAGVVNGMEDKQFNPGGNITREQFCKMVVQLFGVLNYNTSTSFNDVNSEAWYAPYIASAINAGYIQGQSTEYFGIGESIMRQDMAVILYRALGTSNSSAVLNFTDTDSIASYASDAVSELVGLGIINGYEDGSFAPRGTATRAEAAKMIWGVYNLIKK